MIFGINTTHDISKLSSIRITILKYHSWYLCQIFMQLPILIIIIIIIIIIIFFFLLLLFISRHVFKTRSNSARTLLAFPVTYFSIRNRIKI